MTVKHVLQGRPLRHPLHPITIHLPLGLWLFALILDVAAVWAGGTPWMLEGAFWCLALGTGVSVVSAITGFADYLDIQAEHPSSKTVLWHIGMMVPAVVVFAVDTVLHYDYMQRPATPVGGLALSVIGYGLSMAGGYFGGKLVYDDGVGVGRHRRTAELPGTTVHADRGASGLAGFEAVVPESSLAEGGSLRAEVAGTVMALIKSGGKIFAVQEFCTHRCGPLSEGCVKPGEVVCPWHNSRFDLATGKVTHGPARVALKTFEVRVEGGMVHVCVDRPASPEEGVRLVAAERRNPTETEKPQREGKRRAVPKRPWSELP